MLIIASYNGGIIVIYHLFWKYKKKKVAHLEDKISNEENLLPKLTRNNKILRRNFKKLMTNCKRITQKKT